ncbi:MAG: 1,4-alpha-glucan branching enzyme, partial [Pauljensenia sp.]
MSFELTPIPVNDDTLDAVASGSYYSPHAVLGAHLGDTGVTIRTVAHLADAVDIITPTGAYAATHERGGVWVTVVPGKEIPPYRVSVTYGEDTT